MRSYIVFGLSVILYNTLHAAESVNDWGGESKKYQDNFGQIIQNTLNAKQEYNESITELVNASKRAFARLKTDQKNGEAKFNEQNLLKIEAIYRCFIKGSTVPTMFIFQLTEALYENGQLIKGKELVKIAEDMKLIDITENDYIEPLNRMENTTLLDELNINARRYIYSKYGIIWESDIQYRISIKIDENKTYSRFLRFCITRDKDKQAILTKNQ